ncbi:MAG: class I SAM-dependent methyltransferase [Candidatus Nanoarchaeia archaeon]
MLNEKYGLLEDIHTAAFERFLQQYGRGPDQSNIVLDLGCAEIDPSDNKSLLVDRLIFVDGRPAVADFFQNLNLPNNTTFVLTDVRNMRFESNYADLILMVGIYGDCGLYSELKRIIKETEDLEERKTAYSTYMRNSQDLFLKETARVLKPQGHIVVSDSLTKTFRSFDEKMKHFGAYFHIDEIFHGEERYLMSCSSLK